MKSVQIDFGDSATPPRLSPNEFNPRLAIGADAATCREWLRCACRRIGLCFHPDTQASEYVDGNGQALLSPVDAQALDDSIRRVFRILGDEEPYEVCATEAETMMYGL
jgi:hypothetical protein